MSATKLVSKFRRASTFIRDDDGDKTLTQCSSSTGSTVQKRTTLLRSRASLHEKVTESLKLAKQKCTPASTVASQKYVESII